MPYPWEHLEAKRQSCGVLNPIPFLATSKMRPTLQHEVIAKSQQIESYGYYKINFYFGSLNIISTADVPSHPYFPIYTFHSRVPCVQSYSFYTHASPSRKLQSFMHWTYKACAILSTPNLYISDAIKVTNKCPKSTDYRLIVTFEKVQTTTKPKLSTLRGASNSKE